MPAQLTLLWLVCMTRRLQGTVWKKRNSNLFFTVRPHTLRQGSIQDVHSRLQIFPDVVHEPCCVPGDVPASPFAQALPLMAVCAAGNLRACRSGEHRLRRIELAGLAANRRAARRECATEGGKWVAESRKRTHRAAGDEERAGDHAASC